MGSSSCLDQMPSLNTIYFIKYLINKYNRNEHKAPFFPFNIINCIENSIKEKAAAAAATQNILGKVGNLFSWCAKCLLDDEDY
jgi:hypothetical protein